MKKNILLVNNDIYIDGSTHYLINLYKILKEKYNNQINILLCFPYPYNNKNYRFNKKFSEKYEIYCNEILEYDNDEKILLKLFQSYDPILMLFNSKNDCYSKFVQLLNIEDRRKLFFHSHEIYDDYMNENNNIFPNIVTSEKILKQYSDKHNLNNILIQHPVIHNIDEIIEKSTEEITEPILNKFGTMNEEKITIGMCGNMTERKNQNLFFKIATLFPQYNFLWIGGHKITKKIDNLENCYQITDVINPYKYFRKHFDYFLLTSVYDVCPYVIIENILLETKIITFEDSVFFDFKHRLTKRIYSEKEGNINFNESVKLLKNMKLEKRKNILTGNGYKYVKSRFTEPYEIYHLIDLETKLLPFLSK